MDNENLDNDRTAEDYGEPSEEQLEAWRLADPYGNEMVRARLENEEYFADTPF